MESFCSDLMTLVPTEMLGLIWRGTISTAAPSGAFLCVSFECFECLSDCGTAAASIITIIIIITITTTQICWGRGGEMNLETFFVLSLFHEIGLLWVCVSELNCLVKPFHITYEVQLSCIICESLAMNSQRGTRDWKKIHVKTAHSILAFYMWCTVQQWTYEASVQHMTNHWLQIGSKGFNCILQTEIEYIFHKI